MAKEKKVAASYLREFYGPFGSGEHGKGRRHFEQEKKKREIFGPKDTRKIG